MGLESIALGGPILHVTPFGEIRKARDLALAVFIAGLVVIAAIGAAAVALVPGIASVGDVPPLPRFVVDIVRTTMVIALFVWLGRLRFEDLGLRRDRLPSAVLYAVALFGVAQAFLLVTGLAAYGAPQIDPGWDAKGAPSVVGRIFNQAVFVALIEETSFRGFLLPQIYLRLSGLDATWLPLRLPAALVISQGLFAFLHAPFLLLVGFEPSTLPVVFLLVFVAGLYFSWLYIATGSLFISMAAHALVTAPTPIFASPLPGAVLVAVCSLFVVLPWIRGRERGR